jgi:uncharacterized LabA/DUF88 family protein
MMRRDNVTHFLLERNWTLFVDGENFAKRGQDVLSAARIKPDATAWLKDIYLWLPGTGARGPFFSYWTFHSSRDPGPPPPRAHSATRAYYYTSMPFESADEVKAARLALRDLGFEPRVFQRLKGKSKAVDLALATDVLTLAGESQYEVAVIFAGDGDYVPVVEAVKRLGKHVVVCFFADSGMSDELRIAADDFVDLSPYLIERWSGHNKDVETRAEEARVKAEQDAAAGKAAVKAEDRPEGSV